MNASVEALYSVHLDGAKLGDFTLPKLKALHRVIGDQIYYANGESDAAAIIGAVAEHFNIPVTWLLQRVNTPGAKEYRRSWPRQIAMTLIHERLKLSSLIIGQIFKRDHGAVLHAWKIVQSREKAGQAKDFTECRHAVAALLAERKM